MMYEEILYLIIGFMSGLFFLMIVSQIMKRKQMGNIDKNPEDAMVKSLTQLKNNLYFIHVQAVVLRDDALAQILNNEILVVSGALESYQKKLEDGDGE